MVYYFYKKDDIKVLELLVVAAFTDFRNPHCSSSYFFYLINVSS